jgi:hypothetical protein
MTDQLLLKITGNAHYIFRTTCAILAERLQDFVRWPNRDMLPAVAAGFDVPGTVGMHCYLIWL